MPRTEPSPPCSDCAPVSRPARITSTEPELAPADAANPQAAALRGPRPGSASGTACYRRQQPGSGRRLPQRQPGDPRASSGPTAPSRTSAPWAGAQPGIRDQRGGPGGRPAEHSGGCLARLPLAERNDAGPRARSARISATPRHRRERAGRGLHRDSTRDTAPSCWENGRDEAPHRLGHRLRRNGIDSQGRIVGGTR